MPHLSVANVLTSDGQYKAADKMLRKAKKYDHTSAIVLRSSATNFYNQKKYKECIKESRMWSKHHPEDIEAQLYIASSLYELKEMSESLNEYSKALDMNRNSTSALVNSAVILSTLGDHEKASELARKAASLNPSLPEVTYCIHCVDVAKNELHYYHSGVKLHMCCTINFMDMIRLLTK